MAPGPPDPARSAPPPSGLPIDAAAADVARAVGGGGFVLVAEPGAGKSTVVPAWVADLVPGRVLLLEPRRLAARATAARLAARWGQEVGELVGLTIRGERRASPRTRVEVLTEAVLTRRLQDDPGLEGVGAVLFDEFHERSVHADLGLALALEVRAALRPDLVVGVLSATLDAGPVAALLGGAPVVRVPGRAHPVTTTHLPRPHPSRWPEAVAAAAERALAETDGDVLVFVPGRAEIAAVRRLLPARAGVEVAGLHGGLERREHLRLLRPAPAGTRRVVVATAVAETSVTLPGITAVVDGGRLRQPRFDERTGLGRLETVGVSRSAADQRRGRAGRTGPGRCYRLWPADEDRHLVPSSPPEVLVGDPLPLALELARWGDPDGGALAWLEPPPPARLAAARQALVALGLLGADGRLSPAGRAAARLPLHPRLAALVLRGRDRGLTRLAATCAAVLDQRGEAVGVDLVRAVEEAGRDPALQRAAADLARRARLELAGPLGPDDLAPLLAAAWPDRVAQQRRSDPGRYLLAGGGEVRLPTGSPLAGSELLVVAAAGGLAGSPTVSAAVPVHRADVLREVGEQLRWREEVRWDDRRGGVDARRRRCLGALVLHEEPHPAPPPAEVAAAVVEGVRRRGVAALGWSEQARQLQARVAFLRHHGLALPDLGDEQLAATSAAWLPAALPARPPADLAELDPLPALLAQLTWEQRAVVDRLAPTHLPTPGRRPRPVRYDGGEARWAVRIQDLFGLDRHPTVLDGRVPVVVELLTPAGRPAQVTTDLPGFWRGSYRAVRADLRGRYPRHAWPEDPLAATARGR